MCEEGKNRPNKQIHDLKINNRGDRGRSTGRDRTKKEKWFRELRKSERA